MVDRVRRCFGAEMFQHDWSYVVQAQIALIGYIIWCEEFLAWGCVSVSVSWWVCTVCSVNCLLNAFVQILVLLLR